MRMMQLDSKEPGLIHITDTDGTKVLMPVSDIFRIPDEPVCICGCKQIQTNISHDVKTVSAFCLGCGLYIYRSLVDNSIVSVIKELRAMQKKLIEGAIQASIDKYKYPK